MLLAGKARCTTTITPTHERPTSVDARIKRSMSMQINFFWGPNGLVVHHHSLSPIDLDPQHRSASSEDEL